MVYGDVKFCEIKSTHLEKIEGFDLHPKEPMNADGHIKVLHSLLMCFSLTRVYSRNVKKTSKRLTIMKKNKKFVSNYFLTVGV